MQETQVQSLGQEDSPGEGKWQPTPAFLPEKSQGQGSLVGYSLWGRKQLKTTDACIEEEQKFPPTLTPGYLL